MSAGTIDKIRGIISVTLRGATSGISQITISYIVYVNPHTVFQFTYFAYPGLNQNSTYSIIGISGFNNGFKKILYYGISI